MARKLTRDTDSAQHDLRVPADRHGGHDVVRAARQSLQHRGGVDCVVGLAQHDAVDDDFGIRREHRLRRQLAAAHTMPADGGLGARDALDVFEWSFVLARDLDDVAPAPRRLAQQQLLEFDADLPKQLLPARAFRSQIDRRTLGQHEERAHSRWYGCPDSMLVARYSCSASTTRASPCGNVSAESASTASRVALDGGIEPVRAADDERYRQRALAPGGELRGEFSSRPGLAALVERNDMIAAGRVGDPQPLRRREAAPWFCHDRAARA